MKQAKRVTAEPVTTLVLGLTLGALGLAGCAHPGEEAEPQMPSAPRAAIAETNPSQEVAESAARRPGNAASSHPSYADDAADPRTRPRLSRTVTLGRENPELTYTSPPPPDARGPAGGPSVVVNNNVNVAAYGGAAYGGYPGRYGYGYGYGIEGSRGRTSGGTGTSAAAPQWGASGWEGANRTAQPGQTPGVGGNWPAVRSSGPGAMR